jgi:hypothetical protein
LFCQTSSLLHPDGSVLSVRFTGNFTFATNLTATTQTKEEYEPQSNTKEDEKLENSEPFVRLRTFGSM